MNPQSARLAWLAFVLLWCSVLATRPRRVGTRSLESTPGVARIRASNASA